MSRHLKDYSYTFPSRLIALTPSQNRASSRLMVLDRKRKTVQHKIFSDITQYFETGDVLVLNDSRVFPARLVTTRKTGGRQEILLLREVSEKIWQVIVNSGRKLKRGDCFDFEGLQIAVADDHDPAREWRLVKLEYTGNLENILELIGHAPLPPYIRRADTDSDKTRYQTVFAKHTGSVAAPTAGLHFTPDILEALQNRGVKIVSVTLHVGPGTFLPVKTSDITKHKMHAEYFSIPQSSCDVINKAKMQGRRVTAVGTTSTRVLESLAQENPVLQEKSSQTNIFIYPPCTFKIVDRLITNFHQPESTLIMLISAFAGREFILSSYQDAIQKGYRLFSYGDAMMIE